MVCDWFRASPGRGGEQLPADPPAIGSNLVAATNPRMRTPSDSAPAQGQHGHAEETGMAL